jgi:signal transduction histidine kinase
MGLTDEQRKCAEVARKSGETLLSLINDILDLSKIEARKLDLEILDFDLATVAEDTAEMLAVKAREKGLELDRSSPAKTLLLPRYCEGIIALVVSYVVMSIIFNY